MNFKLGEIWLTKCDPSVGKEPRKCRPAIVIQFEETMRKSPYVTVITLTSNLNRWKPPHVFVPRDEKNRLQKDSVAIVSYIASFDHSRFLKKIGYANSPVLRQIRGYLRRHFRL